MKTNIIEAAKHATKECKLLIETGSGIEVLSDLHQFISFYKRLPQETKDVTSICMDTCHVYAAGFMPTVALKMFNDAKVPIELIHFNDSKKGLGSFKDEHQSIGKGMIPLTELFNVGIWAVKNGVSMVHE